MNYSRAVKGSLTRAGAVQEIFSQAELEFGHPITKEEEELLFKNFSPQNIINRIHKVKYYLLLVCCYSSFDQLFYFSVAMGLLSS